MRNILKTTPSVKLSGWRQEATKFIKDSDIKNKTILDMGCGIGWFEYRLIGRGAKKIVGIDVSKELLESAGTIKQKNYVFVRADVRSLPFRKETFDTVVCWEVLEHVPKGTESRVFKEAYRVLKKGGHLFLSTPNRNFFSLVLDPAWWIMSHRHYRSKQIYKLAKDIGFSVELIEIRGGLWTIFHTINMYISKWLFGSAPFFDDFFSAKSSFEYSQKVGFVSIFLKCKK